MPCDCVTYECLDVYYDPCVSTIDLGITADSTGTYKMIAEIDGVPRRTDIEVVSGESIVVPAVFNENYTHLTRFYKPDGTVLNETCYQIKTMATIFTNPASIPPEEITIDDVVGLPEELESLQDQIDAIIGGDGVQAVNYNIGTDMAAGNTFPEAIPANTMPVAVSIGTIWLANEEIGTGVSEIGEPVTVTLTNYSVYNGQQITIFYKPTEG